MSAHAAHAMHPNSVRAWREERQGRWPPVEWAGRTFGRWTVIARAGNLGNQRAWRCRCECGTERVLRAAPLSRGKSLSCGCLAAELSRKRNRTHGARNTKEYKSWDSLKQRCNNPRNDDFARYGGRGIKVCARWATSFETFLADMGRAPSAAHSIDRIDVDGDYSPENCRWATPKEQARNRRRSITLTIFGATKTAKEWAEDPACQVSYDVLVWRVARGWPAEDAFTLPKRRQAAVRRVKVRVLGEQGRLF